MTSDTLTRAIRQRMSSLDDAELLRLWVENDRGQYSGEAFEAVREILAERGLGLPPQHDPPPMATAVPRVPRDVEAVRRDPSAAYWIGWLRPMLWTGVVLECLRLVAGAGVLYELHQYVRAAATSVGPAGILWQWVVTPGIREMALLMVLSAWYLVGARGALRLRRQSRMVLVVYAWSSLLAAVLISAVRLHGMILEETTWGWHASVIADNARGATYPFLLLLFLTRPQIRGLFEPTEPGFDVHPAGVPPDRASAARAV